MANLRSVNTKFWQDSFVETLNISEKLLFLYLITNNYANLAGIYEITIKRICFETGINSETVSKGLERFGKVRKAYFVKNHIVLPNWLKNQNLNSNMKIGVIKIINELPIDVKISVLGNDYQTIQKDYQTIRNTLLKYEVEVEVEDKEEDKIEKVSFDSFWNSFHEITDRDKTDKNPTRKYWEKLNNIEKEKAYNKIKIYWDSLNDKKFCKKARTYLFDKNFNDEFKKSVVKHAIPNDGIERFNVTFVGEQINRVMTQASINDYKANRYMKVLRISPCN